MKNNKPRITLLGNNSGRNLGDAAILSAILDKLSEVLPTSKFFVPSIAPKFIEKNYGEKYNVKAINVLPWTGSIRLLGIPTLYQLARSDAALICDGIIFGRNLFSPHNFLITLIFLVPWAKLWGCKVICYSCGIGPFPTKLSERFARWVINLSDLVIMRDNDSKELAEKIGVSRPISVLGDAAFVNYISDRSTAKEVMRKNSLDPEKPLMGLNVTPYIDSWLEKSNRLSDKAEFLNTIADAVNEAKARINDDNLQLAIFSCSPMDEKYSQTLAEKVGAVVIDNTRYLSHDIQAVMKECQLLVGMRFHSLVLSSSVGVPIVGLIYAPKVRGYMRLLECPEYGVELNSITAESLGGQIAAAWSAREQLKSKQQKVVTELRDGAAHAAHLVKEKFFPDFGTDSIPEQNRLRSY